MDLICIKSIFDFIVVHNLNEEDVIGINFFFSLLFFQIKYLFFKSGDKEEE